MSELYDSPADVIRKALRGLELAPGQVAEVSGVPLATLQNLIEGREAGPELLSNIAPTLGLDSTALRNLGDFRPEFPNGPEVTRWSVPFEDDEVNVWRVGSGDTQLIFDAGFRPTDLAEQLSAAGLTGVHVLITHPHRDHIGGIAAISDRISSLHSPTPIGNATLVAPGAEFTLGPYTIRVIDLAGHHPDALGFLIRGLGHPLCVVGDALYAGSLGYCPNLESFRNARSTLQAGILPLGDETRILPGHGPPTTLAQERRSNPFLAAWQRELSAGA